MISDLATELFIERGFDHVTVAEVAKAADVAVQTVFNHFPTKEDLFFDIHGWWQGPAQAIRETPLPTTPSADASAEVVERLERHYLEGVRARLRSGQLVTWKAFTRTIEESPALLARRRKNAEEMETLMVEALLERDPRLSPLLARLLAAQYAAAQKVLEAEARPTTPGQPQRGSAGAPRGGAGTGDFRGLRCPQARPPAVTSRGESRWIAGRWWGAGTLLGCGWT